MCVLNHFALALFIALVLGPQAFSLPQHGGACALVIRSPPALAGTHVNSPLISTNIYKYYPVVGILIDGDKYSACEAMRNRIVLLSNESAPGNPLQTITYKAQQCGATAVVFGDKVSDYAGLLGADINEDTPRVRISLAGVSKKDWAFLRAKLADAEAENQNLVVDLRSLNNDTNYWDEWAKTEVGSAMQGIAVSLSALVAALALTKLAFFCFYGRPSLLSVPQMILIIRLISNWFRVVYWAIDPMFLGRYFSFTTAQVLLTISFPFEIVGTLIMAVYWQQLLRNKRVISTDMLTYMKVPVMVISILLFLMEFVFAGLRAAYLNLAVGTIVSITAYVLVTLISCVYFFVIGIKVISRLGQSSGHVHPQLNRNANIVRRTSILVGLTAFFSLLWSISLVLAVSDEFLNSPYYFRGVIFSWFILIEANSFVSVLSIRVPYSKGDHSSMNLSDSDSSSQIEPNPYVWSVSSDESNDLEYS